MITAFIILNNKRMRQIINNYSSSAAQIKVNTLLNDKVYRFLEKESLSYSDLVYITYNNDVDVKSVEIDTVKINKIKSGIVSSVQKEMGENSEFTLYIPIGTVIGNSFTLNRGPDIPIDMKMSSAVHTQTVSSFEGSGINQTLHRIVLKIKIDIYIVTPWYRANALLETDFILTETVIVGKVPDAFTVVIETEEDNTGGLINDYGANNYN